MKSERQRKTKLMKKLFIRPESGKRRIKKTVQNLSLRFGCAFRMHRTWCWLKSFNENQMNEETQVLSHSFETVVSAIVNPKCFCWIKVKLLRFPLSSRALIQLRCLFISVRLGGGSPVLLYVCYILLDFLELYSLCASFVPQMYTSNACLLSALRKFCDRFYFAIELNCCSMKR